MRHSSKLTYSLCYAAFVLLFMLVIDVSANGVPPRVSAVAPECAAPGEKVSLAGHGFGAQNVTVCVGDQIAEVLKATGYSAEFLLPLSAPPGITSITVENPGGQGGTIEFQVKGPEICGNNIDDDCDGGIDEVDECPLASIEIDTSPFDIALSPGEVGNISTTVTFTTTGTDPFTIAVTQQVVALSGPPEGISISPNVVGGFVSSMDKATVDNQEIMAHSDGVYEITTTAEIVETGEVVSDVARITVESISQALALGAPGSDPGALAADTATNVVFTVQVQGHDADNIIYVTLTDQNTLGSLNLNDSGKNGDLVAGDGTYSGTTSIDTSGMVEQDCLSFNAVATTNIGTVTSPTYDLCLTGFPIGTQASDITNIVPDPQTSEPAIADEILVRFREGATEDRIIAIVSSVGGNVIGTIPGLRIHQIRLSAPVATPQEFQVIIETLLGYTEVEYAETAVIGSDDAVTTSDTMFSQQTNLDQIRANEAWYIARGSVTIAIVDGGADLDHPDLKNKIIKGKDLIDDDDDPEDERGHGSHVAGIAASSTNNGIGIAGVSWDSKLLIIRVSDENGNRPPAKGAEGIKSAADNGARLINFSGGSYGNKDVYCDAVAYATSKGSLVIASAGNNNTSSKRYPAACAGAIAVGNVTATDSRAGDSNFGDWVDLAAPGENIWSTVPTDSCGLCDPSGYRQLSGTSMATPMVTGAAAVLLSRQPELTNAQVETRLERTAVKLPSANLGAGRIDLFEAVFNGSFEEGNLALWTRQGTASSKKSLGSIVPQDRERMGSVSTGPAGAQTAGALIQSFTIQPGVTSFPISFKYAFVTEEYPEWVGSIYDDSLKIKFLTPSGSEVMLAEESVNASSFMSIGGIDFPGGDTTVGWTGWKYVSQTVPVTEGPGVYRIILQDAGDAIYDTETLIDEIKFR